MTIAVGIALSPTWLRGEAWRRPDSGAEEMFSLEPYLRIARAAQEASLDFLFVPEANHLDTSAIGRAPGFSTIDSHTLVSALAAVTSGIGLVPTVQTAFADPYSVARRVQSLHRISGGRAGWNAVTALGGQQNFGGGDPAGSAERYARAAEFVRIVRLLWDSFPAEALLADRESGRFADAERVRPIDFVGEHFRVAGPLSIPAHPSGRPPLFQAGASPAGVAFAGATADAVFGCAPDRESAVAQRGALREAAVRAGREPDDVRFLPGLSLVLDRTREAAREQVPPAGEGAAARGPAHWRVVGTPDDAVGAIEEWVRREAVDGFIALPGGSWRSIGLFFEEVAPRLAERGLLSPGYVPGGLRAQLRLRE